MLLSAKQHVMLIHNKMEKEKHMKKRYLLICILINILGIAIIPLNLLLFEMPEWITIVLAVLMVAAYVIFLLKGKGKIVSKTVLCIFLLLSAGLTLFGAYCNPYWNSYFLKEYSYTKEYNAVLTYDEAKRDLDYFMHYLEKDHPLFIDGVPDNIQKQYDKVNEELKNASEINVTFLYQEIQSIASLLKDGHTSVAANYENITYLKWVYSKKEQGCQLIKVNDIPLDEILKQKSHLYSYEVESWAMELLKQDLYTYQWLYFLGLNPEKGVSYTYLNPQGEEETNLYHTDDFVTDEEYNSFNQLDSTESEPFVSYNIDKEKSLAVLTLKSCNYNQEYCNCLKEMFTQVKELGIENVAVDIRDNGGGNSLVADEFIKYLDVDTFKTGTCKWRMGPFNIDCGDGIIQNKKYSKLTFCGNVYCLTSTGSFSSAMLFAEYIKDNRLGTIIGEAPGNTPTCYGDIAIFRLPNSSLYFQTSTKHFFRADSEATDNLVSPDVECDSDEAMDVLLDIIGS